MKLRFLSSCALAAILVSTGANAQEMKAEVIHWWTSAGESAAVRVFAEQFQKAGGTWIDTAIAGGPAARTAAINRTVGGNPPAAMQFNTGKQFDDLVENNLLADLDQVAKDSKWASILPEDFIKAVTRNGKYFAVPVNIHGQNWVWYSTAALEKAGASPPTNWDDIFVTLDKLKAAGLIPLAFSGQKNWERALFNTVLAGQGGRKLWESIYSSRDANAARSPEFRKVAETYARLKGYVDAGSSARNWPDATNLVITGRAGMQFMGDWAKGEFASAGMTPGKEYGCAVVRGAGGGYIMGGDVFAFPKPKDAAQAKAQATLARVMLEPDTQIRFAQKKGSIPIRLDADGSSLDACAQTAMKMVADKSLQVPSQEMLSPPALTGALEDLISQFWNNPGSGVDAFVAKFADTLKQPF
jgi:glucose/mannose transport system substrate-binding protein